MKLALPHNVSTDYQKASFGPTSDVFFVVQMGQYHNEADRLKATLWTVRFRPASESECYFFIKQWKLCKNAVSDYKKLSLLMFRKWSEQVYLHVILLLPVFLTHSPMQRSSVPVESLSLRD